ADRSMPRTAGTSPRDDLYVLRRSSVRIASPDAPAPDAAVMTSTYVDDSPLSTFVDTLASPAALLPGQLAELTDHVDEELTDDRFVGRVHEVEGGPPLRPGHREVVRTYPAALVGHVEPDHPPVSGIPAPLHVALAHQRVDHRG